MTSRAGLVLAAGLGSRLAEAGGGPKPLTEVAGTPLFVRTLRSLQLAGCDRVVIVVGFRGDEIQSQIQGAYDGPLPLEFVANPDYKLKNGVSALRARAQVGDDFVMTMADHVLGDEVMEVARTHRAPADGAALLVDRKLESIFDMDDATKVVECDGKVIEIGKQLTSFNAVDTGVFLCTPALLDHLDTEFAAHGDVSLSEGVAALARAGRMDAIDIGDGFWQDVDTPDMLGHAESVLRARGPAPA